MNEYGISVTSNTISQYKENLYERFLNSDYSDNLKHTQARIKKFEATLSPTSPSCSISLLEYLRDNSHNLDTKKLSDLVATKFYSSSVMEVAMCITESVVFSSNNEPLGINNRIRRYIDDLTLIPGKTAEGLAMTSKFVDIDQFFVVKIPKSVDNLFHEAVVGLYGTNNLRKYVPNFAYVYGVFSCAEPIIGTNDRPNSWLLNNNNSVNYVLYENITPAITVQSYIKTCTASNFLNLYMQILHALMIGIKYIDFTHYDLRCGNVLLRIIPDSLIPYESTNKSTIYFKTNVISTIIDYGFSHIDINGVPVGGGNYKSIAYGIDRTKSSVMHDAHKFLMCCMHVAKNNNNIDVFDEGKKLFKYFNVIETLESALEKQKGLFYSFPLQDKKWSIDNLIVHIRNECDCDFILEDLDPNDSTPILKCDDTCQSSDDILKYLYRNYQSPLSAPDNIVDFYDLYFRLQNQDKFDDQKRVVSEFNYDPAIAKHKDQLETMSNVMAKQSDELLKNLNILKKRKTFHTKDALTKLAKFYDDVAMLIDRMATFKLHIKIGISVADSYGDTKSIEGMMSMVENLKYLYESSPDGKRSTNFFKNVKMFVGKVADEINKKMENSKTMGKYQNISPWFLNERIKYENLINGTNFTFGV